VAGRRLILLVLASAAIVVGPTFAGADTGDRGTHLHAELTAAQGKLERARAQEATLSAQLGSLDARIRRLESKVGDVAAHLSVLQADVALRRRRLAALAALYGVETSSIDALQEAHAVAIRRLEDVLVRLYESPPQGVVELALQATSFHELLDELADARFVAAEYQRIADHVVEAARIVQRERVRTAALRLRLRHDSAAVMARLEQVAIIHAELLTSTSRLRHARNDTSTALLAARLEEQAALRESSAIRAASARLESSLRAAQTHGDTGTATPSQAGFIWPVQGPITSPFGPRWGSFHPGIDIAVPEGTPIRAAAAGTVVYCGWESGYGNLVVIDHHNGLATAYGHQSSIAVSCGQDVAQGEVIGYVGCTGFCTGPHLHFEVRVNGAPVDPIGYLS
jgi:murein DD-endopeptidase MepM/ murein hydrolase activator NlpD